MPIPFRLRGYCVVNARGERGAGCIASDGGGVNFAPCLRRSTWMTTLKLTVRYARYLLTSLATVAFGSQPQ